MRSPVSHATQQEVVNAVAALVESLQEEGRRLGHRLADIERELATLAGKVNERDPRLGDVRSAQSAVR